MKKIYAPDGPSSALREAFVSGNINFIFLVDEYEAAMGGGRAAPCLAWQVQKTGARSARARTRGKNPLVHK